MQELPYRTTRILKTLGNPLRYRLLARLARGPATPSQLAQEFNRPIYVISHTLAPLRALDLIWYHPQKPYLIYEAKYDAVLPLLAAAEHCARSARLDDPVAAPDDTGRRP